MVLVGLAGDRRVVAATEAAVAGIAQAHAAVAAPAMFGRQWDKNRFRTPYLRNALWEAGYAVDTLETAVPWSAVEGIAADLAPALRRGLADEGERVHAFMHLSHVYPTGSSLYTTYIWRLAPDPDVKRSHAGAGSRGSRARRSSPPAGRSATSTASGPTTPPGSRPKRAPSGWRRWRGSRGPSIRAG